MLVFGSSFALCRSMSSFYGRSELLFHGGILEGNVTIRLVL